LAIWREEQGSRENCEAGKLNRPQSPFRNKLRLYNYLSNIAAVKKFRTASFFLSRRGGFA